MSLPFLLASGLFAGFLYMCMKKTPYLNGTGKQTDNPTVDRTSFVSHYADPADTWSAPWNLTTDPTIIRKLKQESGPYGIPRTYYTGPGNSKVVNYGEMYTSI